MSNTLPSTFIPPKEHLGATVKTRYGNVDVAEHVGFTRAYEAVYASGSALLNSVAPVYPGAYSWKSASFFTGVTTDLGDEFIQPVRDIVSAVTAALQIASKALELLGRLARITANIYKAIIEAVLKLLRDVLSLLNPSGILHALIIPPRLGKLPIAPDLTIQDSDSVAAKNGKRSEQVRQDFIDQANSLMAKLPASVGIDLGDYTAAQSGAVTGSEYLLQTIRRKLTDRTDLARPQLRTDSYSAGVGIFLGTSALNSLLDAWRKVNVLLTSTTPAPPSFMPPEPRIVANRIAEINNFVHSSQPPEPDSVTSNSIQARPVKPKQYYQSSSSLTFEFTGRFFMLTEAESVDSRSQTSVELEIQGNLRFIADYTKLLDTGKLGTLSAYATMSYSNGTIIQRRTNLLPEKLPNGFYYAVVVDVYALPSSTGSSYINLRSKPAKFEVINDPSKSLGPGKLFSASIALNSSTTGQFPRWVAAPAAVNILPDVVGKVVEFIQQLETTLTSILDDALDWITNLLEGLSHILNVYLTILNVIDGILELLYEVVSLTNSVGASVMTFYGKGGPDTLASAFADYLSPDSIGGSSGSNSKVSTEKESSRLQQFSKDVQSDLLGETLTRNGPSYLDSTGNIAIVNGNRVIAQNSELNYILEGGSTSVDGVPSITSVAGTSYNKSPVFTPEMTTAGVILLATSDSSQKISSLRALLNLLFSSDEPATQSTAEDLLNSKGLVTDLPNLEPDTPVFSNIEDFAAMFTGDMQLTTDPAESPFDFCPED